MKTIIRLFIVLLVIVIASSCLEQYKDIPITPSPQIAFLNTDTSFTKQYGDTIKLEAIVVSGNNITHEWKFNDQVCSQTNNINYPLTSVGTFKFSYTASNEYGIAKKEFTVTVKPSAITGVTFSTIDTVFTKSIGESLNISVSVLGTDPVIHEWKVNDNVVSTTSKLNYTILEAGEYNITYKITKANSESIRKFKLTAIVSPYGRWFVWQDNKKYVICLKDDETKVVANHAGSSQFVIENYTGSNDQVFMKGGYFGYGDKNVQLEYTNIYNLGTNNTLNEKGAVTDAQVTAPGNCAVDGWRGWYFIIDAVGNIRMSHFLETWDYAATYAVALKGCIMRVSDDKQKLIPVFYDRCKVDGVREHDDYNALGTQYYDFKIKSVEDMK
jgi:hypothetical protein